MPSLTLTDPDMILPYDGERESQTPSPPSQLAYLSNLNTRHGSTDSNVGSSTAPAANRPKKNFSRHARTHEDVNVTRRLSDIGEELSPARLDGFADGPEAGPEQGLASSPLLREHSDAPEARDQAAWSSSNSTISAGSKRAPEEVAAPQNARAASPKDKVPEPANAPSGVDESKPSLPDSNVVASAAAEGKGPGDEFSSAILSSEAERILENAKKRLTVCGKSVQDMECVCVCVGEMG